MPRRLPLTIAALAVAAAAGAGCADDVSPAASFGDDTITHDELLDEVDLWSDSPTLVGAVAGPEAQATVEGANHDMSLVTVVLTNRILFDVYGQEFERRDLEVDEGAVDSIAGTLLGEDAQANAQLAAELEPDFLERLATDVYKLITVQEQLGADLLAFQDDAFTDVEVSSRYGRWDRAAGAVVEPSGPSSPPDDVLLEL